MAAPLGSSAQELVVGQEAAQQVLRQLDAIDAQDETLAGERLVEQLALLDALGGFGDGVDVFSDFS